MVNANPIDDPWAKLTEREFQVTELVGDELTYEEIGEKLGISPRTAEAHAKKAWKKLSPGDPGMYKKGLMDLAREKGYGFLGEGGGNQNIRI